MTAFDGLLAFASRLIRRATAWPKGDRDEDGATVDPRPTAAEDPAFLAQLEQLDRIVDAPPALADDPRFGSALEDLDRRLVNHAAATDDSAWAAADDPGLFAELDLPDHTAPSLGDDANVGAALEKLDLPRKRLFR